MGFAMLKDVEESVAEPIISADFSRVSSGANDLKRVADKMAQNIIRRRTSLIASQLRIVAELEETFRSFDLREVTSLRHLALEHLGDVENIVAQQTARAEAFKQEIVHIWKTSRYPSATEGRFVRRQDTRAIAATEQIVELAASYLEFLKRDVLGRLDDRLRESFNPGRSVKEIAQGIIKRYPVVLEQLAR